MNAGRKMDTVFILVIFCVFAVSVLTVMTLGVNAYTNMNAIARDGDGERTCLTYIWSKVKNGDRDGKINAELFHDIPALCLDEEYNGKQYKTRIYFYDGWVRELFSESGMDFKPEDGTAVMEAESLSVYDTGNGVIKASSGGKSLLIYPRSGTGGLS